MYLQHITLNTAHISRADRADVSDAAIAMIAPWMLDGFSKDKPVPLPVADLSHYSAHFKVDDGALICTVYAPFKPHVSGQPSDDSSLPVATFAVAQRSRHAHAWGLLVNAFGAHPGITSPSTPWLAVHIHESAAAYINSMDWLGDFERCCAWAWITRNTTLESV